MPRRPRSRVRRAAKWAGLMLPTLVACAWLTGPWWEFAATWSSHGGSLGGSRIREAGLRQGAVRVIWLDVRTRQPTLDPVGCSLRLAKPQDRGLRWSTYWFCTFNRDFRGIAATLPLWIPCALLGAPTGVLWWRSRVRVRRGHCPACGYDLAGLPAGAACPECGEAAARARDAAAGPESRS